MGGCIERSVGRHIMAGRARLITRGCQLGGLRINPTQPNSHAGVRQALPDPDPTSSRSNIVCHPYTTNGRPKKKNKRRKISPILGGMDVRGHDQLQHKHTMRHGPNRIKRKNNHSGVPRPITDQFSVCGTCNLVFTSYVFFKRHLAITQHRAGIREKS